MELKDSPAEAEFRAEACAWLQDTLPKLGGEEPARLEDKLDYWRTWQRLLYDAGYAGLSWPKEYGGGGVDAKLNLSDPWHDIGGLLTSRPAVSGVRPGIAI